ncbi:MAG TPA: O-antigen ligase family protein [Methylophilus sp.]
MNTLLTYRLPRHDWPQVRYWVMTLLPWALLASRTLADLAVVLIDLHLIYHLYQAGNWRQRIQSVRQQPWLLAALLFFSYLLLINSPAALHPTQTMLHGLYFIRWPLFALALSHLWFADRTALFVFLKSLCLACTLLILDCSYQFVTGVDLLGHPLASNHRLTGPYHAPLPGIMLVRVMFIAHLLWLLPGPGKHRSTLSWLFLTMAAACILLTGERMALLLFGFGLVLLTCCGMADPYFRQKMRLPLTGLVLLLGLTISLMPDIRARAIASVIDKLAHFASSDYGLVFKAAIAAWQQQPWLGHGLHSYREVCDNIGLLVQWGMTCTHPHNLYLLLAAETGLIGTGLFCGMVVWLYLTALRPLYLAKQWRLLGNHAVILSMSFLPLIGGISLWNNWVAALTWTGVGCALAVSRQYALPQH